MITKRLNTGSTLPGTCEITDILMTNYLGDEKDIRLLVKFLRISETIESPTLMLQLGIVESSNFFEEFKLSGTEKITIRLKQRLYQGDSARKVTNEVDLEFYVIEYPEYAKSGDQQSQVYTIMAMSHHAFIAPLKKISRSIKNSVIEEIKTILTDDLAIKPNKIQIQGNPSSLFNGIINWTNPLNAAINLQKKLMDDKAPFFMFQRLNGDILISSLSYITDPDRNPVYRYFQDKTVQTTSDPNTVAFEEEAYKRIQSISSVLSLNRVKSAIKGAYASEYNFVDSVYKMNKVIRFDYAKEFKAKDLQQYSLSKKDSFPLEYNVDISGDLGTPKPLNKIYEAAKTFVFTNRLGQNGDDTASHFYRNSLQIKNIFLENLNACTHTIKVSGDLLLNPGKVINLELPKATDMVNYKKYTGKSEIITKDEILSGDYLIYGVEHMIDDSGNYNSTLLIKKDSI